jgi:deoxyribodipyrimidine photo-lyase
MAKETSMGHGAMEHLPNKLAELANNARVTVRRDGFPAADGKCVVYWMQRAQRGVDNHAVNLAVAIANELGLPLVVYFAGISNFPHANLRHYVFLQQGLLDVEADLHERNISFVMRRAPHESHERFLHDVNAAMCIGDENPMREPERWRKELAEKLRIPFWTVDTDVVVPSKLIEKAQYGAYTIRPRLYRLLPEYLVPYQNPKAAHAWRRPSGFYEDSLKEDMTRDWKDLDRSVGPVDSFKGGTHEGLKRLKLFCSKMLANYEVMRNKPEVDGTSAMSPYLRYGHVGPQTIALAVAAAVEDHPALSSAKDSYFNELIAWRELAINFVWHTDKYDSAECAEDWAKKTIAEHARDEREHIYTLKELEEARTHDDLWNAAQIQMVKQGWMHNYMRMYWAKKILEWTPDVDSAMKACVYLDDKYFLDGRDPNGYAGIAWAILGKFDRAWGTRPIFGKRRYMSGASTGRKFDSKRYIRQMQDLRDGLSDSKPGGGRRSGVTLPLFEPSS